MSNSHKINLRNTNLKLGSFLQITSKEGHKEGWNIKGICIISKSLPLSLTSTSLKVILFKNKKWSAIWYHREILKIQTLYSINTLHLLSVLFLWLLNNFYKKMLGYGWKYNTVNKLNYLRLQIYIHTMTTLLC